jgi:hypothetical protein
MQHLVGCVIDEKILTKAYLDYDSKPVNWDFWLTPYIEIVSARIARGAPCIDGENKIRMNLMMCLYETFVTHICKHCTYTGSIELQIIVHAIVLSRFWDSVESMGDKIYCLLKEIQDHYNNSNILDDEATDKMNKIINHTMKRVHKMASPIVDGKLLYTQNCILGLDPPINW